MTVNFSSDRETDRMLSLRASSRIPLPPEIALCDPPDAREYFGWMTYYEIFGVSDHPMVKLLGKRRLDAAIASAVSRASHLDRVSHYSAWMGDTSVRIVPPLPTRDDENPEGGDERGRPARAVAPGPRDPSARAPPPIPISQPTSESYARSESASIKAVAGVAARPQPRRPTLPDMKIT